jgi:glycosyltransferase involved in cell wall biosynthesis
MRFSIVIPSYNYSSFLDDCLKSCFEQTFVDFDIILIDDGSPEVMDQEIDRISKENKNNVEFQFHRIKNVGAAAARNYAVSLSEADYIVFLDSDDILDKDALMFYDYVLKGRNNIILTTKRFEFKNILKNNEINIDLNFNAIKIVEAKNYFENRVNFRFGASNIIVPRYYFELVGGFRLRTEKTWHAEDHDLLLKLGDLNFVLIEEPYLVFYRRHDNNSILSLKKIGYGVLELIESNKMGIYPGAKYYSKERMEIIGGASFQIIIRLIRSFFIILAIKIFLQSYKYIYLYIKLKTSKNGKRKSI